MCVAHDGGTPAATPLFFPLEMSARHLAQSLNTVSHRQGITKDTQGPITCPGQNWGLLLSEELLLRAYGADDFEIIVLSIQRERMLSYFSCVRLFCNFMDYSPPDSSLHGILQERILEWVANSSSEESS